MINASRLSRAFKLQFRMCTVTASLTEDRFAAIDFLSNALPERRSPLHPTLAGFIAMGATTVSRLLKLLCGRLVAQFSELFSIWPPLS